MFDALKWCICEICRDLCLCNGQEMVLNLTFNKSSGSRYLFESLN